jgi:spore coat polysaccharide biosynthesis protein SpsF (cytidylyltransferase family)
MKIVAIVQARMGSSRLPGKVLAEIDGRPVVDHVLRRAARITGVDEVVLAVPDSPEDDVLARAGESAGVSVVRGDAADVLNRYHDAAVAHGADAVVRITADCPLIDPAVSALVVRRFTAGDVDYVSNTHPPTYPDGYDTEVFSTAALVDAWREAAAPFEREHVTPFIWLRPDRFRLANVADSCDRSSWRLTVDTASDLSAIRSLWTRMPDEQFGLADVIALDAREPQLISKRS